MIFSWLLSDKILPPLFSRPATKQQAYLSGTLTFLSHAPRASTLPVSFLFRKLFLKTRLFFKTKLFRLKPGQSAVLVRGHGYSNSFTLCRGCTLLIPQDLNYPPVDTGYLGYIGHLYWYLSGINRAWLDSTGIYRF